MRFIDGDAHFIEPLDVFERYTDPAFRERTMQMREDSEGIKRLIVDGKPMQTIDVDELLAAVVGYGQKEVGKDLSTFDRYLGYSDAWQDMGKRVTYLNEEGFDYQVIYPTLGLFSGGPGRRPVFGRCPCVAPITPGPLRYAPAASIVLSRPPISRCATQA